MGMFSFFRSSKSIPQPLGLKSRERTIHFESLEDRNTPVVNAVGMTAFPLHDGTVQIVDRVSGELLGSGALITTGLHVVSHYNVFTNFGVPANQNLLVRFVDANGGLTESIAASQVEYVGDGVSTINGLMVIRLSSVAPDYVRRYDLASAAERTTAGSMVAFGNGGTTVEQANTGGIRRGSNTSFSISTSVAFVTQFTGGNGGITRQDVGGAYFNNQLSTTAVPKLQGIARWYSSNFGPNPNLVDATDQGYFVDLTNTSIAGGITSASALQTGVVNIDLSASFSGKKISAAINRVNGIDYVEILTDDTTRIFVQQAAYVSAINFVGSPYDDFIEVNALLLNSGKIASINGAGGTDRIGAYGDFLLDPAGLTLTNTQLFVTGSAVAAPFVNMELGSLAGYTGSNNLNASAFVGAVLMQGDRGTSFGARDTLIGGFGNDIIYGHYGDDTIVGNDGDDELWGGSPIITTADGNDSIVGGFGNDNVRGGNGIDWFYEYSVVGDATFSNGSAVSGRGFDQISSIEVLSWTGAADNNFWRGSTVTNYILVLDTGIGNDTIYGGGAGDYLYGGAGNDIIAGGAGNDIIFGLDGNDSIWAETGNDTVNGGPGVDFANGGVGFDSSLNNETFIGFES